MAKKKKNKKKNQEKVAETQPKKEVETQPKEEPQEDKPNLINIIARSNMFRFFMIGLLTLIIFFSLYSYVQHKIYQNSLSQHLPLDTTYAFLEIKNSNLLDQTQRLKTHPNQEEISQLLQLEEGILNKTSLTPTLKQSTQKNISIQYQDENKYYLFLYELPESKTSQINFPVQIIQENSDKKWYYALKDNLLTISDSKELSLSPFQESTKLKSSQNFQDAFQNTPKHNIAWFAINHSLANQLSQDSLFPNNNQTYLKPITQFLGFTVGYLNINSQGLLIGMYSNPSPNLDINLSPLRDLDRFKPSLHKHLPPLQDIDLLVSATDSYTILELLLQNNPNNEIQLQNIATKRNISSENLEILKEVFSTEYLIYKQSDAYNLILPSLDEKQKQSLLDTLSNLEAFHNPVLNAYRLEDGSTAKTKSPSEPISRDLDKEDQSYAFRLKDIDQTIQLNMAEKDHIKLTYSPGQAVITPNPNALTSNQEKPEKFLNLLPEASSHMYISQKEILNLFQSQDLSLYPANVNSSSYFFDDGIQTLLQLTW